MQHLAYQNMSVIVEAHVSLRCCCTINQFIIPLGSHKAATEVSKIGRRWERSSCWNINDGVTGALSVDV